MSSLRNQVGGKISLFSSKYKSPLMLYLRMHEAQMVYPNVPLSHSQSAFIPTVQQDFYPWSKTISRDGEILLGFKPLSKRATFLTRLLQLGGRLPIFAGNFVLLVSLLDLWKISLSIYMFLLKC